jgi:hypothetical protein
MLQVARFLVSATVLYLFATEMHHLWCTSLSAGKALFAEKRALQEASQVISSSAASAASTGGL